MANYASGYTFRSDFQTSIIGCRIPLQNHSFSAFVTSILLYLSEHQKNEIEERFGRGVDEPEPTA